MSSPDLRQQIRCAHGVAFSMSDLAGKVENPNAMRNAWAGVAELLDQVHTALHELETKPATRQPQFDEAGYYRALSSLEVLYAYLVNEDKPVDSARLSFVIDAAVKELQRSVVI